ncbi:hypothetical protein [Nocardia carnea]|uniref:hypothetical protein n=1 Tax=Nocardia carnea TaxID=37328 RepID=UPI0024562E72|nr:hypothetical protein [Nocardia carnea]
MSSAKGAISVRPMIRADLDGADEICRLAFGTALGVPDPSTTFGSAELVRTRWAANPDPDEEEVNVETLEQGSGKVPSTAHGDAPKCGTAGSVQEPGLK